MPAHVHARGLVSSARWLSKARRNVPLLAQFTDESSEVCMEVLAIFLRTGAEHRTVLRSVL